MSSSNQKKKMKLFHAIRQYFEMMGIRLSQPNRFDSINRRNILFLAATLQVTISTGAFVIMSKTNNTAENAFAFYQTTNGLAGMSGIFIYIWRKDKMFEMMESFKAFVEKRSQTSTAKIEYAKLAMKIEWMSKFFYIILMKISFVTYNFSALLMSLVNYFILNLGDESFYVQYPTIIPFKWAPPFGYLLVWLIDAVSICCVIFVIIPGMALGIGVCWWIAAFINDTLNELDKLSSFCKAARKNACEIKVRFCNIIQLYSETKQFICNLNEVFEFLVLTIFAYALLSISTSMFAFVSQLSDVNANRVEIIPPIFSMVWSFAIIFGVCEFGQQLAEKFVLFEEELGQFNWYLLPIGLQRMFVIVMANAQQTNFLQGYGNIQCTRDAFKQTVHASFSYFMVLRNIDA